MQQLLAVGCGGFLGAVSRYALTGFMQRRFANFLPAGTMLVNLVGCFLIGVLMTFVIEKQNLPYTLRLFLITGFLGSLTTFSTFGYETVELFVENQIRPALFNVAGNLVLGFSAVWLAKSMTSYFLK